MVAWNNPLQIQVAKHAVWQTKQPRIGADVVPSVPCRIILSATSGSGKTMLLVDMLTRIYAGCFERVYVFSPSIHIDSLWTVVKDYSSKELGAPPEEETFFDTWDEAVLSEILTTQKAIVKHQKEEKASNKIFSICVVVDDFADDQRVMASRIGSGGSAIITLFTCWRPILLQQPWWRTPFYFLQSPTARRLLQIGPRQCPDHKNPCLSPS